jgi:hypothetical protein
VYQAHTKNVMHFAKGQPAAEAFWSLTMYDAHYFFVPNALDRYTLSSRRRQPANSCSHPGSTG